MISLYNTQRAFLNRIRSEYPNDENFIERIKDYCLGINKNVVDVLNALDWDPSKELKSNSSLHQKIEIMDAAVDVIKYAVNLCIEEDIQLGELMNHFSRKHRTVEQKLDQKIFLRSDRFKNSFYAFIIDIDGVIADIVWAYKLWFGQRLGKIFETFSDFDEWRIKNIDEYKVLKEEYRLSGQKMKMRCIEGTKKLLEFCKSKGIVSLLSNRPVKTYPIIYMYTIEWLQVNDLMPYVDMVHFTDLGEKKYFFDKFNGKEVYFLEDNVYNIINIEERPNVCNLFIRNETNQDIDVTGKAIDCKNLKQAMHILEEMTREENRDIR